MEEDDSAWAVIAIAFLVAGLIIFLTFRRILCLG